MKKISRRSFLAATGILTVSAAFTACAGKSASGESSSAVSAAPESTPASSEAVQPTSYLFTDDLGREVEVDAQISRIVPSAPLPQIILLAIAPEMFVGLASKFYEDARGIIPDEMFELPYFGSLYAGSELNVEELAMTEPQLIIDIGEAKKSSIEDLDALQQQTLIPSVFISATLKTMPETYRKLGKLLGKEEKGEQLAQFCERVYNRTLDMMDKVGDNKVSCLYVLGDEGLNVIAANSYHSELLDLLTNNLAVVDNPLSKGSGNEVTMEQIAAWDPEFVVFAPRSIYSKVKQIPAWDQIQAIENDRYVETPDVPHNWMSMPPSVQRYLGLIWLPAVLYPDYCDYDVKEEIMEYYELFYGCTLTEEQYQTITEHAFLR